MVSIFFQLALHILIFVLLGLCACWYFRRQTPQPSSQTPGVPGDVRQQASSADGNGPSTSSSSQQDSRPLECSDLREGTTRVRAPFVFNGDADMLREWVFAVEMAMKMQALRTPSQMVDFAAMHLSGNACLWFLNAKDAALTDVFGPLHEQEQARLRLMSVTQESTLDEYINLFSRLSLFLPEVDDHTRALLFVHGLSKTTICDRDPRFTSAFFQEVFATLGTSIKMSAANYPQTDGQTERMNRIVEDTLRSFINHRQDNWDQLLPLCVFAINNSSQASTEHTPFFLNCGQHP